MPSEQTASAQAAPKGIAGGLLLATLGAIAFSGKAIIVKLGYRYGADAVLLLMLRMAFALPLFLVMAWWAGRGKPPLTRRDWWGVLGLGFCGYYLSSYLDFAGLQYITASLERLILYLNPTLVVIFGWVVYKRSITWGQLAGMGLSYCGVLLVFGHELGAQGSHAAWGAFLVLASAISYAVYLIYSGEMVRRLGSLRLVGLATSVACLFCIAQYFVVRDAASLQTVQHEVLWLSLLNALLCTAAPVLMVMMAIERIGPGLTAQTGMIGPLSTILMGVWLLDEGFNRWMLVGTCLVMGGILLFTRMARRH